MLSSDTDLAQDSILQQKTENSSNIQPKKFIRIVQSSKIKKYVEVALSIFQVVHIIILYNESEKF